MLSVEDNELLTKTGPATPMGQLFRRFWLPVALASEVGTPQDGPVKINVLNEQLAAYRNADGTIGLLEAACPHRLANLFWGRNEGDGLRCVYHGWKFAADGQCLEQPAEPLPFADRICTVAYPTKECGGILWAYLGPKNSLPPFPLLEFTTVDPTQVYVSKRLQLCNWMQNLEGEIDSAHVQQLHAHAVGNLFSSGRLSPPRYQIEESSVGLLAMAVRQGAEPGETYWRVTPYLMPSFTIIPAEVGATQTFTAAVPIDDVTMAGFTVTWNPVGPLTDEDRRVAKQDDVLHVRVDPQTFLPLVNKGTNYSINRAAQASGDMTGIPGLRTQDLAVQEDQCGPISQREREHLGSTDRAIVLTRRLLLETARALAAGVEPTQPQAAAGYLCHSVAVTTHSEVPWQEVVGAVQPSGGALICPSTPSREAG